MKNLTFKTAMLNDSRTTVNRQSTDGQSQRHYKQTPLSKRWKVLMTLVFLFTFAIGQMWGVDYGPFTITANTSTENPIYGIAGDDYVGGNGVQTFTIPKVGSTTSKGASSNMTYMGATSGSYQYIKISSGTHFYIRTTAPTYIKSVSIMAARNSTSGQTNGFSYKFKSAESYSTQDMLGYNNTNVPSTPVSAVATGNETEFDLYSSSKEWIILSISVTLTAGGTTTTYDVTLNPNDGAYASTPEGWTESAGKYTKSVTAGALAIPTPTRDNYDFAGWKSGTTSVALTDGKLTVSKDTTLVAQWVAEATKYAVTYTVGAGSGTAPAAAQYAEGVKFNLPGQGSMVAPAGKAFDGWKANGTGDKLAANAEYTMGDDAVQFVAQWKAVAQTIFDWTFANNSDISSDKTDLSNATYGTMTTGTSILGRIFGSTSIAKNSSGYKLQSADACFEIKGTYDFIEGDTIKISVKGGGSGERGLAITPSTASGVTEDALVTSMVDGSVNGVCTAILTSTEEGAKIRVFQYNGKNMYIKNIKVIRPAARDIASTEITLSDVKVNNRSISSDSLTTLVSAKSLLLKDEFVTAPEIKFNEHKVITYADELLPATKVTDKVYTVTATLVDGNWQAQATINAITYTVTAPKQSSAKVYYYDGETKIGEETVAIGGHPAEYASHQGKDYATFVAWYNNSDLVDEHKITNIAELVVNEATNVYGKWAPAYASSINIEKWVLDNGVSNSPFRAELTARHYKYATLNNLDSLNDDPSKPYRNYAYLGQKVNKTDSEISFLLKSGSTLNVRFGHLGSKVNVVIGSADPVELTSAEYANDAPGNKVYTYTATADVIVKFQCTGTSTSVFKQIMIDEEIQNVILPAIVTLDANGGTYADESVKYTGTALVIGDATPEDEYHVFAGWFDGDDQIDATAYVPTKNVTLQAHYANKPYTVTYVGGEGATNTMDPVQVAWGDDYTALACGFEKENHSFVKWTVAGVDAISEIAAGSAFVMPKGNVTLTAQWANDLLVARIGDDYYESLPLAVAAAIASEETSIDIQLLAKDGGVIEGSGVKIPTANKTITIDFNGMKYIAGDPAVGSTGTETQAFQLLKDNNITLKNGAIACKAGSNVKMLIQNYSNLTLKNIRLEGENLNIAASSAYTLSNNNGAVVIGNGTEVIAKEGGIAFDVCYYASYPSVSVTVQEGASIDGKIEMSMSNGKQNVEENCQLIVTGGEFENFSIDHSNIPEAKVNAAISAGTFDAKVENLYCAEGFVPSDADAVTGKYTVEPKDGVCIIKANVGDDTFVIDEAASLLEGTTDKNNVKDDNSVYDEKTGWKLKSRPARLGLTLSGDETFQEGDVVEVFVTSVANIEDANDKMRIFDANEATAAHLLYESEADMVQGVNRIVLPATTTKSLYLHRTKNGAYDNFNPYVAYVAVYRPMMPKLTAITIDGRDGVINEANKTVAVQIPYEANLANLTIASTVVRNAAHATTPEAVISNEGAWVIGDNTYRVMDKDGDYTIYTITLTRDQLKHTVRFMDGTSEFASALVVDGESPVAPATDPEKEDYLFQGWAETVDGDVITDWSAISISAAKDFYAKWVSDGAIKLLNGATVNHTNFITGVSASKVTISSVEYYGVTFAGGVGEHVNSSNIKNLDRHVTYNATTTQTKFKLSLYNSNGNKRTIYVKGLVEGASAETDLATIELTGNEQKTTEWIEFNNAKNRSIYVFVSGNAGDIKILQEKIIESGDALKMAGEAGYSINLNKGRWFGAKQTDLSFEGMGYNLSSDYTTLSSTAAKLKSSSFVFDVTAPVTLQVTSSDDKTYYVTKGSAGTDNPTAKSGVSEFDLTVGKWYITAGSSEAPFTKIAFIAPRCAKPTIETQPATKQTFGPGNLTATVVATVSDGGTLKYQWYKAADDSKVDGATEATLTTTTEGTYYVIVTNTLADHSDNSIKSESATLGYRVMDDATLSALSASAGTLDPTFAKNVEEYRVDLPEGTVDVPTLSATATMDGYANVAINNAAAFVDYEATSTVVVTSEDGSANKTYTVKFYVDHQLPQVDVTESTTWDWTYAAEGDVNIKVTTSTEPIKKNEEGLMANVRVDDKKPTNDATFNSQALLFYGENVRAKDSGRWYASLGHIKFNVTKPGIVEVEFSDNGSNNRCLSINGFMSPASSSKTDVKTFKVFVPAGEVTLMGMEGAATDKYIRISKITYTVKETPNYTRNVSNNIGTLCVEHNVLVGGALGATFYQIASRNADYDYKIDFEEVLPNEELKAGEPYIFQSTTGKIELFFSETTSNVAPIEVRGMIGNYDATTLDITEENKSTTYYFAQNKLWNCEDLVDSDLKLNEHRAYIDFTKVPTYADYEASKQQQQNNAPRRRVSLVMNGEQVATGIENGGLINGENGVQKVLINGKLFILRGEKMYDVTGKLVK